MGKYSIMNYNFLLSIAAIALSVYGIFIIGSAKESVQSHQIQGLVLGVIVMIVISLVRYDLLLKLSWLYYVLAVGLLIMVEIAGESVNNAKRWIVIAGIQFQPSEAAKILIIMFFASFISKREEKLNSARNLLLSLLLAGLMILLHSTLIHTPNGAGMEANIVLLGEGLLLYGVFHLIFFPLHYRDTSRVGLPFLLASAALFLLITADVVLSYAFPFWRDVLDTPDPTQLRVKLLFDLGCVVFYILATFLSLRVSQKRFLRFDIR